MKIWLGHPNLHEKYFAWVFLLSIVIGTVFGFFDKAFYNTIQGNMPRPRSALEIFLHNFSVDLLSIVTGGVLILWSNFITFSAISGLFEARHIGVLVAVLALVIVFGTYGTLEMVGHLLFGLIGFTYLERVLWKKKTKLNRDRLLALATVLVFVAAVIEWYLGTLISGFPP